MSGAAIVIARPGSQKPQLRHWVVGDTHTPTHTMWYQMPIGSFSSRKVASKKNTWSLTRKRWSRSIYLPPWTRTACWRWLWHASLHNVLYAPADCCSEKSWVLEKLLVSLVKEPAAWNKLVITRMRGVWQYWLKARTRDLVAETLVLIYHHLTNITVPNLCTSNYKTTNRGRGGLLAWDSIPGWTVVYK